MPQELAAALRANAVHLDELTRPALWQLVAHPCIYRVSGSLTDAGLYQQAIEYDERTARHSNEIHGPDHPDTLSARNNLAVSYSDTERVEEALNLGERALADCERILGNDHPATLIARKNLARARDAAAAVQQLDTATPATVADLQPPSDASE
ncbi:tetratricopeptide repeat protein [Streptomyces seoulensis]|uniref:tetratricopeptide repeat protein n=1 Tax=Streptomyces seoulensis TaxID=73044 RepID=UPI003C2FF9AF